MSRKRFSSVWDLIEDSAVLSHFAAPSPSALSQAQAAAKIRRLLDEFGHPAATRR